MHTLKIKAHIDSSHRIEIQLPNDTPEGDADVIVMIPSNLPSETLRRRHLEVLLAQSARSGHAGRSVADIDRQLAEERDSWGE